MNFSSEVFCKSLPEDDNCLKEQFLLIFAENLRKLINFMLFACSLLTSLSAKGSLTRIKSNKILFLRLWLSLVLFLIICVKEGFN